jgi:uncharacterized protein involved in exopolysaccharide biosynthesis
MQTSVTTQPQSPPSLNDEAINLRDLFYIFRRDRWMIISVIAACALTAGAVALLLPKEYEASVLVSPVASSAGGGQMSALSSLATQFGGLASLAGVSVSGDSKRSESVAVLQSEALTEQYIQANNLLPVLFRKKWDTVKEKWTTTDPTEIPTLWKANRLFNDRIRKVSTETKTGLVTMTIRWTDPHFAATWANGLVKATNEFLRERAIRDSETNIVYLNGQAAITDAVGVKQAIYTILQSEISKAMLARGSDEYALKVIDPAVAPEKPFFPKLPLWLAAGIALGMVFSAVIVIFRSGGLDNH